MTWCNLDSGLPIGKIFLPSGAQVIIKDPPPPPLFYKTCMGLPAVPFTPVVKKCEYPRSYDKVGYAVRQSDMVNYTSTVNLKIFIQLFFIYFYVLSHKTDFHGTCLFQLSHFFRCEQYRYK